MDAGISAVRQEVYMRAENNSMVPELCRRRLLRYADYFAELSGSFGVSFDDSEEDRQTAIVNRKLWENRQVVKMPG